MFPTTLSNALRSLVLCGSEDVSGPSTEPWGTPERLSLCLWLTAESKRCAVSRRASVRDGGAGVVRSDDRGREGQRPAHGGEGCADGRGLREGQELAEGRLPQTDDRGLQGDQRSGRRLPQGAETLGQETQGGTVALSAGIKDGREAVRELVAVSKAALKHGCVQGICSRVCLVNLPQHAHRAHTRSVRRCYT